MLLTFVSDFLRHAHLQSNDNALRNFGFGLFGHRLQAVGISASARVFRSTTATGGTPTSASSTLDFSSRRFPVRLVLLRRLDFASRDHDFGHIANTNFLRHKRFQSKGDFLPTFDFGLFDP